MTSSTSQRVSIRESPSCSGYTFPIGICLRPTLLTRQPDTRMQSCLPPANGSSTRLRTHAVIQALADEYSYSHLSTKSNARRPLNSCPASNSSLASRSDAPATA